LKLRDWISVSETVAGLDVPTAICMDVIVAAAAVAPQARGLLYICPIFHICVASLCDVKYIFGTNV
jgi:hypothetical protein